MSSITAGVARKHPDSRVRVAVVPYWDYDDPAPPVLDFTGRVAEELAAFMAGVEATGGGDEPEDVVTGLEKVAALKWSACNRLLVHIADSPCHGGRFHLPGVVMVDQYPAGDKLGRDVGAILRRLRAPRPGCAVSRYSFFHIKRPCTAKMVEEFRKAADGRDWIRDEDFLVGSAGFADKIVAISQGAIAKSLSCCPGRAAAAGSAGLQVPER